MSAAGLAVFANVATAHAQSQSCPDGTTRQPNGWCVGDLFLGVGGPRVEDANGFPLPQFDGTTTPPTPKLLLSPGGQPIPYVDRTTVPPTGIYPIVSTRAATVSQIIGDICTDPAAGDALTIGGLDSLNTLSCSGTAVPATLQSIATVWPDLAAPVCVNNPGQVFPGTFDAAGAPTCATSAYAGGKILFEPRCLDGTGTDNAGGVIDLITFGATCPLVNGVQTHAQFDLTIPQVKNGGTYLLADQLGNLQIDSSTTPFTFKGVINPLQNETMACATDPVAMPVGASTINPLWTSDFRTNEYNMFSALGSTPAGLIDIQSAAFDSTTCGTSSNFPFAGCGGSRAIVFDTDVGDSSSNTLYIGTSSGTNRILQFSRGTNGAWSKTAEMAVPVPVNDDVDVGISGMDLAADRQTLFYTAFDGVLRVVLTPDSSGNLRPIKSTDLGTRLIAAGMQLIKIDGTADSNPDVALYGAIPFTTRSSTLQLDHRAFHIRLMRPGDPLLTVSQVVTADGTRSYTPGIIVALESDIGMFDLTPETKIAFVDDGTGHYTWIDQQTGAPATNPSVLSARTRTGFFADLAPLYPERANYFGFQSFDLTPDGRSFWAAGIDARTNDYIVQKVYIPTQEVEVPPFTPAGASAVYSVCLVKGYAAGATQPSTTQCDPANPQYQNLTAEQQQLCNPLPPACPPPDGSFNAACISPTAPQIAGLVGSYTNYEGDPLPPLTFTATDPSDPSNTRLRYFADGLPAGVTMDPMTGALQSTGGTPTVPANTVGPYAVTLTVTVDPTRLTDSSVSTTARLSWQILHRNLPPPLQVVPDPAMTLDGGALSLHLADASYNGTVSFGARDPDRCDQVKFVALTGSLPAWLQLVIGPGPSVDELTTQCQSGVPVTTPFTATIVRAPNTPITVGAYDFTIEARDDHDCDFEVANAAVPPTPLIDANNNVVYARPGSGMCGQWDTTGHIVVDGTNNPVLVPHGGPSPVQLQTFRIRFNAPTISNLPSNLTLEAAGPGGAVATFAIPTGLDAVGNAAPVSCSSASGSTFPIGTTTVTCTATDAAGSTTSGAFTVTVADTTPPSFGSVPSPITAEATGAGGASVSFTVPTATDLVSGIRPVACAPSSGSTFALGNTTVNCSAVDAAGNSTSTSFLVTVVDTTPPAIGPHANVVAEATGAAGAIVGYTPPATQDLVDGTGAASCLPAPGAQFALGSTHVTCSASDAHGNAAAPTTFSVLVQDTTPPAFSSVPAAIAAEATGPAGAAVGFTPPTATDVVSGVRPVSCTPASGSTFALGSTTVSCSTADPTGNSNSTSFVVTIVDTTPPVLSSVPAPQTLQATGPTGAIAVFTPPTANDLVSGSVSVTCTRVSGSTFPLGTTTVTCSATDAHLNSASASFDVIVIDTTPPALTNVPPSQTREATGPAGAMVTFTPPTATDLVNGVVPVACSPASGSIFALGTAPVTCSASDEVGNTASASFNVTVVDTTPPALTLPSDMTKVAPTPAGITVDFVPLPSARDLVDDAVPVTCSPGSGTHFDVGATVVTCSAVDAHGNRASGSFKVTVTNLPPVCTDARPSVADLWPPNHTMVPISVLGVTDPNREAVAIRITRIMQDEPTNGLGDGDTPIDGAGVGASQAQLRAERSGKGDGRVYIVSFSATNADGLSCSSDVTVRVPHDQGDVAVDSQVRYDSTVLTTVQTASDQGDASQKNSKDRE